MAILLVSVPDDIDGLDDTDGLNEDLLVAARMDWEPPVVALRTTLPDGDFDLSATLVGRAFACALGFAETTLDVELFTAAFLAGNFLAAGTLVADFLDVVTFATVFLALVAFWADPVRLASTRPFVAAPADDLLPLADVLAPNRDAALLGFADRAPDVVDFFLVCFFGLNSTSSQLRGRDTGILGKTVFSVKLTSSYFKRNAIAS